MDNNLNTPEALKMLTLQFMGQQLGELKELDKRIVNKTNTLQGVKLDVKNVLGSIPGTPGQPPPQPPVPQQHSVHPIHQPPPQQAVNTSSIPNTIFTEILAKLDTIIKLLEK
jgi:hypothetical protein